MTYRLGGNVIFFCVLDQIKIPTDPEPWKNVAIPPACMS